MMTRILMRDWRARIHLRDVFEIVEAYYEDRHRRAAVLEYRPDAGTTQALFISLLTFRAAGP
jgi:hypothetical protein